jgi:hypothetical protein
MTLPAAAGRRGSTSQYVRANIDPSERYVLSVPGTVHLRLESGNSGFANLFLAGRLDPDPDEFGLRRSGG